MHHSWPPQLGRLDAQTLLRQFPKAAVYSNDDWDSAEIELNEYFGITIALPSRAYGIPARALVAEIISVLPKMDDEVLLSCISEQQRSGLHGRNFQNALAMVTIQNANNVTLSYFGTGVNTEWDETFVKSGNDWLRSTNR